MLSNLSEEGHKVAVSLINDFKALLRVIRRVRRRRTTRAALEAALAARPPLPGDTYEAAVYFADPTVNLYQIRQWYEPMRRLAEERPVVVIARSAAAVKVLLEECPLPVFYGPTIADIETFVASQRIKVAFYVNQNMRNFQMMRFPGMFHVFVSHGESDKIYMASNQAKAYDYCFVAGDAAVERIKGRLLDFDAERRLIRIGRPQVDVEWPGPRLPADERTVVLYAPTWEGDRPSMSYGSVASHGVDLVANLISTGKHRVIFRPHPRTGVYDPAAGVASQQIADMLTAANKADPSAGHVVDTLSTFGWQLQAAHVCVCDISAVAFDWMATGKPLMLTYPISPEAEVDLSGIAGVVPMLAASDAATAEPAITALALGEVDDAYRQIIRHHFGDTTPGASMLRFLGGCRHVMAIHDRALAARPATVIDLTALEARAARAASQQATIDVRGAMEGPLATEMEDVGGA